MKNVCLSHHMIWWLLLLCALFLSICVDGVVKAHDAFSPSHWTGYSITFRINYPPLPTSLSLPLQVQGLWSGSIRPVQAGQFTDWLHQLTHSEVERKIQHVRIQQQILTLCINKSILFKNYFNLWNFFFLLWTDWIDVEFALNPSPTLSITPPTRPPISWKEKTQISPKCFIAMKRHANRTEQQ